MKILSGLNPFRVRLAVVLACAAAFAGSAFAQERIDPEGVRGALVIAGGGELPKPIYQRFVELAGGDKGRLVVIPTAADDSSVEDTNRFLRPWSVFSLASVVVLHTRSRETADRDEFVRPLKGATAVWFGGGLQSHIAEAYLGTAVERELAALLERGGVIGGTSAGAAIQSRVMIRGGNPDPLIGQGFDLLPGAIVDQHFSQRHRQPRLRHALKTHPGIFGLGVDEETAAVITGRRIEVIGEHKVTCILPGCAWQPEKTMELTSGDVADLTTLRRSARSRQLAPPLPEACRKPEVPRGALFIAGGGRLPQEALKKFVELAGGENAKIVVLPTASEETVPTGDGERRMLQRAGVKHVTVLAGRTREEVESDESRRALEEASGVWFGGGRQWRFVDAYEGTSMVRWLHGVLERGGVIGGSSAGASIQAEYLVRGSPLGNREMMAEGYEQGFAFLPGTAIDQHFSQRKRQPDMEAVMEAYPQLLGIGIDEGTVLVVRQRTAEVIGSGSVFFYDGDKNTAAPIHVRAGQPFNIADRRLIPEKE